MGVPATSSQRRAVLVLALVGALAVTAAVGVSVALTLAPGALLLLLLAHGIRPGEALIERLRGRRDRGRRRPAVLLARPSLALVVVRTGRRRHAALAMRPPPAAPSLAV